MSSSTSQIITSGIRCLSLSRSPSPCFSLIDIGVNLQDSMFQGIYNNKTCHAADLPYVLHRAKLNGVDAIIATSTTLQESKDNVELCRRYNQLMRDWNVTSTITDSNVRKDVKDSVSSSTIPLPIPTLYCTVGVHPTRCGEFEAHAQGPDDYFNQLMAVVNDGILDGTVVAIGECGLDYDRTQFCEIPTQLTYFERQLDLAFHSRLPIFFHNRNSTNDFLKVITQNQNRRKFVTGVVHSFDGSLDEMVQLLAQDLYIGLNGCSLKMLDNISVAKEVPMNRLMIETDAPWCDVRPTHASYPYLKFATPTTTTNADTSSQKTDKKSKQTKQDDTDSKLFKTTKKEGYLPESGMMIKGRNEPCTILYILNIISNIKGVDMVDLSQCIRQNTENVFFSRK